MKKLYLGINNKLRISYEKKIVSCVDSIIASTALEVNDLVKYYKADKKKISVVSPGVNHHIFKKYDRVYSRRILNIDQNKRIILFIGRIDPVKRINLLIEAVSKLAKTHPSFENQFCVLIIGGDITSRQFWQNGEVKKIKYLIAERDLECCVKFIGSQPHGILPYYYSAADVVVMPSVYESFGLVVLEALTCGAAVLASPVGGMSYLIKDKVNGRHFERENYEDLSAILWELLNDEKQRIRLGKHAQKTAYNYCWDKQIRKIAQIYREFV